MKIDLDNLSVNDLLSLSAHINTISPAVQQIKDLVQGNFSKSISTFYDDSYCMLTAAEVEKALPDPDPAKYLPVYYMFVAQISKFIDYLAESDTPDFTRKPQELAIKKIAFKLTAFRTSDYEEYYAWVNNNIVYKVGKVRIG